MKHDIIRVMKSLAMAVLLPAMAFGVAVGPLPAPEFADTEVTAHHRLEQPAHGLRGLDFRLDFSGTPSNNVEIALGRDADGDGRLSLRETDLVVGWDCGRYFVERFATGERFEEPGVGADGAARSLAWHCALRKNGGVFRGFAATNEVGAAFASLAADPPGWLYSRSWDLMRLTARGVDARDERFFADVRTAGFAMTLR